METNKKKYRFFYSPNREKRREMDKKEENKLLVPDRKVPKRTNKDRNTQKQTGKLTKRT